MKQNKGRKHEIIEILRESYRPLALSEIAAHYSTGESRAVAVMVSRMVKSGQIARNQSGGHTLPITPIAPRDQCLLCIERGCTIDALAELWEHGYREGRGV